MDSELVHEEVRNGVKIEIVQDTSYQSPDEWGNEDLFLVGFHSDFTVEREGFGVEVAALAFPDRSKHRDEDLTDEQKAHNKDIAKRYHVLGLEAYIHSGVVLALSKEGSFPDRQWDVSQLGAVFVSKKDWPTKAKARKAALGLIEEWNDCLSGNVYGYNVEDSDSCWGFYGDYRQKGGCLDQAREVADQYYAEQLKQHEAKRKAQIKKRVPLAKRKAFAV